LRIRLQQARTDISQQERRNDESGPESEIDSQEQIHDIPVRRRRADGSLPDTRPASQCDAPRAGTHLQPADPAIAKRSLDVCNEAREI
jgi:hypothetical protein